MRDLLQWVRDALAGRYDVERELGQGGMATVFLARDLRHDRNVAIKVLRPELAESLGAERFLREIRVAARLNHPNILALHDSGEADGILYYVMPLVTGESLAARLKRLGPLPVDDAISIAADVAEALDHANRQGVVHRDIKPGNILMADGHAFVADFGLAHALEHDQSALTSSGLVVGTPMYMSPEQIGSAQFIDGRSDQYSLGCVLYEMLVGEPPFSGASVQQVFARHAVERVPGIRSVRSSVPELVEAVVHRMLAKNPADRFPDSGEVARVLRGESKMSWSRLHAMESATPGRRARWPSVALVAVLAAVAGVAGWRALANRPRFLALRDDQLAVLPFTAANSADSAAIQFGLALSNLLPARFTGVGGPAAADPSGVRAALERIGMTTAALSASDVRRVARLLGTGLVMRGQVVSASGRARISVTIESAADGVVLVRLNDFSAAPDSVSQAGDDLAAYLLASLAREPPERVALLQRVPITAVRLYLAGELAYAQGRYTDALARYKAAAAQDSSFVLPALGWFMAGELVFDPEIGKAMQVVRANIHALPAFERRFASCLDRSFTDVPIPDTVRNYSICERVAQDAPNRPDVWFQLGWILYQQTATGLQGARERAQAALEQAVAIDSTYAPALGHLLELLAWSGDTTAIRRVGARYVRVDTAGDLAPYYRWLVAASLNDQPALDRFRQDLAAQNSTILDRLISTSQMEGIRLDDALAAAHELKRRSSLGGDLLRSYQRLEELALNRGRPAEAAALMREARAGDVKGLYSDLMPVFAALYWGGDSTLANETVARLVPVADAAPAAVETSHDAAPIAACAVGLWRVARGELDRLPATITRLARVQSASANELSSSPLARICGQVLEVRLAEARHSPSLEALTARLDLTVVRNPEGSSWALTLANLTLASIQAERGAFARARDAMQRRIPVADAGAQRLQVALSTTFREEGQYALLAGDHENARRAWGRYLALRHDPEPAVKPEVERIRAQLAELE